MCSDLCVHLRGSSESGDYLLSTEDLIGALKDILRRRKDYKNTLEFGTALQPSTAHQLSVTSVSPGSGLALKSQERFYYLSSLGLSWSEVASLLGVCRLTIYRCAYMHVFYPRFTY